MEWEYKREESEVAGTVPEGKHRIRVKSAEKCVSKQGKDMLSITFEVSGYNQLIFHYIVFMPDKPEITNRKLTQFFDSFKDIPEGSRDLSSWIGKTGACMVKHEEYNDKIQLRIHYFLRTDEQSDLPAWIEPKKKEDGREDKEIPFTPIPEGEEMPWD